LAFSFFFNLSHESARIIFVTRSRTLDREQVKPKPSFASFGAGGPRAWRKQEWRGGTGSGAVRKPSFFFFSRALSSPWDTKHTRLSFNSMTFFFFPLFSGPRDQAQNIKQYFRMIPPIPFVFFLLLFLLFGAFSFLSLSSEF